MSFLWEKMIPHFDDLRIVLPDASENQKFETNSTLNFQQKWPWIAVTELPFRKEWHLSNEKNIKQTLVI